MISSLIPRANDFIFCKSFVFLLIFHVWLVIFKSCLSTWDPTEDDVPDDVNDVISRRFIGGHFLPLQQRWLFSDNITPSPQVFYSFDTTAFMIYYLFYYLWRNDTSDFLSVLGSISNCGTSMNQVIPVFLSTEFSKTEKKTQLSLSCHRETSLMISFIISFNHNLLGLESFWKIYFFQSDQHFLESMVRKSGYEVINVFGRCCVYTGK